MNRELKELDKELVMNSESIETGINDEVKQYLTLGAARVVFLKYGWAMREISKKVVTKCFDKMRSIEEEGGYISKEEFLKAFDQEIRKEIDK